MSNQPSTPPDYQADSPPGSPPAPGSAAPKASGGPGGGLSGFLSRNALPLKLALLGFLTLMMLIPLGWIRDIVGERADYSRQVKAELGQAWGGAQTIAGPVLVLPIETLKTLRVANPRRGQDEPSYIEREERQTEQLILLPETQAMTADLTTQTRRRGLYEALLYGAEVRVEGRFALPSREALGLEPETKVFWDRARILVSVGELGGVRNAPTLSWGEASLPFETATAYPTEQGLVAMGSGSAGSAWIEATLPPLAEAQGENQSDLPYSFEIALTGSGSLGFLPLGRDSSASLTADWPHPSFQGQQLPVSSEIDEKGFSAAWRVSHLARGLGQVLRSDQGGYEVLNLHVATAGLTTRLIDPLDLYGKATRAVKYGILFIGLTFATLFIFEVRGGIRLHAVQYGLVGVALTLFYLLLLSLAEVIGFAAAFWSGAAACLLLVSLYAAKVTASRTRGLVLGGLLAGIYGYLFMTLRSADSALLMGSLLLLAFVAAVMYATRDLDWYGLGESGGKER